MFQVCPPIPWSINAACVRFQKHPSLTRLVPLPNIETLLVDWSRPRCFRAIEACMVETYAIKLRSFLADEKEEAGRNYPSNIGVEYYSFRHRCLIRRALSAYCFCHLYEKSLPEVLPVRDAILGSPTVFSAILPPLIVSINACVTPAVLGVPPCGWSLPRGTFHSTTQFTHITPKPSEAIVLLPVLAFRSPQRSSQRGGTLEEPLVCAEGMRGRSGEYQ